VKGMSGSAEIGRPAGSLARSASDESMLAITRWFVTLASTFEFIVNLVIGRQLIHSWPTTSSICRSEQSGASEAL